MVFAFVGDASARPGCCWISAEGDITAETPSAFRAFMADHDISVRTIRLHGGGVDHDAAMELGRLFREYDLTTIVGTSLRVIDDIWAFTEEGVCAGACTLAFMGGSARRVPQDAALLASRFIGGSLEDSLQAGSVGTEAAAIARVNQQAATGRIVEYLVEMGVDPRFYALAVSIDPALPGAALTRDQVLEFGIDNISDGAGRWRAVPFGNGFYAETTTPHSDRSVFLYCIGGTDYFVAFHFPYVAATEEVRAAFALGGDEATFTTDRGTITGRVRDFYRSEDGRLLISFSIDGREADMFAGSHRIRLNAIGSSEPGALADPFAISIPLANTNLPRNVLRVCRT
ncbi:hypothetical protein roselon_00592 [Roseibacterium elongatum DSM 19469]|uniref:Uncharacterized protein n=2 Tax=Roseicyclus elongatus TaxID=159346 RepID=W8RYV1_9RHOB|nr:hypothetical protein roselon_00592 [Roseibacterium elongatum DSM 19469]